MAIWGAMLAFLLLCAPPPNSSRTASPHAHGGAPAGDRRGDARIAACRQRATPAGHHERAKALVGGDRAINARQTGFAANHRQNKILLLLLTLFIVGQILVLEYRLPDQADRADGGGAAQRRQSRDAGAYARRRDEIGAFAQALRAHFAMVRRQQEAASAEQAKLSGGSRSRRSSGARACRSRTGSARSSGSLEGHAGRMSSASENLATMSSRPTRAPAASAQSTERVSAHIDVVASSIQDIAATLDVGRGGRRADLDGRRDGAARGRGGEGRRQGADRSGADHRTGHRADRGRRRPDQSPGAQCHHRGGARRRDGPWLRRRGARGQATCHAHLAGDRGRARRTAGHHGGFGASPSGWRSWSSRSIRSRAVADAIAHRCASRTPTRRPSPRPPPAPLTTSRRRRHREGRRRHDR